jgi:hypothetical protein
MLLNANSATGGIAFALDGVLKMKLDASGNLGLGVTPSAWSVLTPAMQLGAAGSFLTAQGSTAAVYLGTNAYFDGTNFRYVTSGASASYLSQAAGVLSFLNAPSGTAGNAITFTQAMTLDASGNLGVGCTPIVKTQVRTQTNGNLGIQASTVITGGNKINNFNDVGSASAPVELDASVIGFLISAAEKARITSGGYFKASNNATYIDVTGGYHEFRSTGANATVYTSNTHASDPYGIRVHYTAATPNNTDNWFLYCNDNTAVRAYIRSNGGLTNYQANNTDLSDARTKTDITPAASMWDKVAALEIVTYKYTDQTHDDVNVGVIAQQVETVEPVWVDTDGFGETPEGEEPLKTVYTKDITFAAIKALQEAMARIEALEARLEALEA